MANAVSQFALLSTAISRLEGAADWWLRDLSGLLRGTLAPLRRRKPVARVSETTIQIAPPRPSKRNPGRTLPIGPASLQKHSTLKPVVLELGREDVFVHEAVFPSGAAQTLEQAFLYQVDRLTPFRREEIVADIRSVEVLPAAQMIRTLFALVLRATLEKRLAALQSVGLRASKVRFSIEHESKTSAFDFSPHQPRLRRLIPGHPLWAGLAVFLAASTLAGIEILKTRQISGLTSQADVARVEAASALSLAQQLEQLREANTQLRLAKSRPAASEIVGELARVVPKEAWVESIAIEEGSIRLTGFAKSAVAVLKAVEESGLFAKANFAAPISLDASVGRERFDLRAVVSTGPNS